MNIILFETIDTISFTRINKGLRHSAEGGMICQDAQARLHGKKNLR